MNIAYFGFPHLGGTFQVFRHLRVGLEPAGINVQWVGLGDGARQAAADPCWSAEMGHGFAVGGAHAPGQTLARQLIGALEAGRFDAVFVNVLADAVQTNVTRYLPAHILRVLIVHNITPGTYGAARAVRDHVHATVAISPRIRDDLSRHHGFKPKRVVLIPHATDPGAGPGLPERQPGGPLKMLFLGRIEDQSKGVLSLPGILDRLPASVSLTVAGDGPDLINLKRRCVGFGPRVRFLGPVPYDAVASLLASHHVMVMPSRFEGFGLTLIEAMAAGCVPVASQIRGVTDWIVEDGQNGLLFPVGGGARAAMQIARLERDRALLSAMGKAARARAATAFGTEAMACRYVSLLKDLRANPPAVAGALDLADWRLPRGLGDSLRTHVPVPVKNLLRRFKEGVAW